VAVGLHPMRRAAVWLAPLLVCGLVAVLPSIASAEPIGTCHLEASGQPNEPENETALNIHNEVPFDGTITEWFFFGTVGGNGTVDLDLFKPGFETHPELLGQIPFTTSEVVQDETVDVPANIPIKAGEGIGVTVTAGPDSQTQGNVSTVLCTGGDARASGSFLDIWDSPFHTGLLPNKEGPGEIQAGSLKAVFDPPVVTSVTPESGPAAGGTEVTITGEHLANAQVYFPEGAMKVPGQTPAGEDTEVKVITPEAVTDAPAELQLSTYPPQGASSSVLKHKFTYIGTPRSRTPQLVLQPVTNITETSAQLHATVNVEGLLADGEVPGEYCYFGYGAHEVEEGEEGECDPLPEALSETPEPVSAQLNGLFPGTTYHYFLTVAAKYGARSGYAKTDDTTSFKTLGAGEKTEEEKTKEAEKTKETEKAKEAEKAPAKELVATIPAPTTPQPIIPPKGLVATIPVVGLIGGGSLTATPAGVVPVKVSCPAGESSCIGSITLTSIGAVGASTAHETKAKKKPAFTLATGSFTVAGGKTATVQLHLSAKAKALLKHSHSIHAQATILAHDSSGATHTTKATITIHAAKPGHGH
jgi:hypothetical protein